MIFFDQFKVPTIKFGKCFVEFMIPIALLKKFEKTSFHKGVFLGPEYFNNILGTNSHIKETCIAANFESNGPLVWCLLSIKSGGVILYQPYLR